MAITIITEIDNMFELLKNYLTYNPKEPLIFNTALFLFYFLVLLFFYQFVYQRKKSRVLYLTIFSIFFYYKSGGMFFLLLILSTVVDFNLAKWIYEAKTQTRKTGLLIFSLVINLGLLAYFKYTNFFVSIMNDALHSKINYFDIVLPVGISFYTFQVLSYTIDVYRNQLKPSDSILDFGFYITFFPHLVAGPIVRAKDFLPQIGIDIKLSKEDIAQAVFLIITGLFKKAVISDFISVNFVDRIFDNPTLYSGTENLLGVYGYAMQIYCDFSGYSDMAIGVALLLGYRLGINFNLPYQSSTITEFWRRWHISLSSWLRDYLYIPLGGNKKGKIRQYVNLSVTMLLGGLWHGASWNFIFWGAMHGLMLALDKLKTDYLHLPKNKLMHILGIIFTFNFVCFCWIFFRSPDFKTSWQIVSQISKGISFNLIQQWAVAYPAVCILLIVGYITHLFPIWVEQKSIFTISKMHIALQAFLVFMVIWLVIQVKGSDIQPFIYFQF
jgi:D-alanyl-lipoteichoic acid acyltransferase DltB (MBOAT superfamily)